ncbi:MAG: gamma-glutamyl-gamma-aminobutyrate hydrolase family protein [Actinomycetota bacterium]|nr:gamma-glutamyl-gamma-aminobutyrate hydrolase family protein [Actinomycetota bacterium]
MRPLIGLSAYSETASWGVWSQVPTTLLAASYSAHVYAAGGQPVLIPPYEAMSAADAQELLGRLDGLLLSGGVDVAPEAYGKQRHPSVQASRPDRDATETLLADTARDRDLPLLGVCRGMQVMAVAAGGSIDQHLPDILGHTDHLATPGVFGTHPVTTVTGSRLARIVGQRAEVASYHHQGVASHPGYTATAHAADGTVEGLEDPSLRFCVAVQWHPEMGEDSGVFAALVDAARS